MAHRTGKLLVAFLLLVLVLPVQAQRRGDAITISIPAAAIQGATTGHAYWINVDDAGVGSLVDAGTSIAAANPTNQPPFWLDVARFPGELSWSVFYGAQTGNVGGKIGMAELWPSQPVEVPGTIPPYVRDVASHWLVTAGLTLTVQSSLPEAVTTMYDVTSAAAGVNTTPIMDVSDFMTLNVYQIASGAAGAGAGFLDEMDAAGNIIVNTGLTAVGINGTTKTTFAPTSGSVAVGAPSTPALTLGQYVRVRGGAGGAASFNRVVVVGERKRPLRKPARIAPYIQWVNPGTGGATPVVPTAASPIYLVLRGR